MNENDIFMHENEKFAPGMSVSPLKFSWEIVLYTVSCMEFLSMNIFGQNL